MTDTSFRTIKFLLPGESTTNDDIVVGDEDIVDPQARSKKGTNADAAAKSIWLLTSCQGSLSLNTHS